MVKIYVYDMYHEISFSTKYFDLGDYHLLIKLQNMDHHIYLTKFST